MAGLVNHLSDIAEPHVIRAAYAGQLWPDEQIRVLSNSEHMFPVCVVQQDKTPLPLARSQRTLESLEFRSGSGSFDLYDYVSRNRIAGLLILKRGAIVLEQYHLGLDEHTRWLSMSIAKSVTTTLIGIALKEGLIDDLDDLLIRYLPELSSGGYADVTIRNLLCMSSGVRWNESHTDPSSERRQMLELQIAAERGSILRFMSALPKVAAPGTRWNYNTGETHLVGELLRAATGCRLSTYLTEKLWSRIGTESHATWWLDAKDGLEVAGSGIAATLRDYGRFGLFVLNEGRVGGVGIVPDGWFESAGSPRQIGGECVNYGYMWWPVPNIAGDYDGAFSARGIFGQRIYADPKREMVVVVLSARSKPMYAEAIADNDFFNAVAAELGD